MNPFRADLHSHSTASDGTFTPTELITHAKEIGLAGLCITDHDTVNGYAEAIDAAQSLGLLLGSGVEFSSTDQGMSVHVLGYDIDIHSPDVHAFCLRHIERRRKRNQNIIDKLASKGMLIDATPLFEAIEKGKPIGRPHIAKQLIDKGYVRTIQEAFDLWLGDGKPCFDPGHPISTDETLEIIHQAGGKAFLAHPHFIKKKGEIARLLSKPFDGIECYYSKCTPAQEKKWIDEATKRGLLISGGSDFHGAIKPHIPLGCSWVGEETFHRIFEKNTW